MFNKEKTKVINLGCRLNFFESEVINGILSHKKHENKIVVNTCAVTNNAVQKSILEIRKLAKHFPDKEIIVTGCASQVEKDLFKNLKNVHRIIDNKHKTLPDSYESETNLVEKKYEFPELLNGESKRTRATIQIQQGCNHRCTFCIIPYGRGDSLSLPVGEVSRRVENVLQRGFKELIFTGVDLTSYGEDLPGKPKLGNLLKRIFKLHPNLSRLRLSSIDPAEIDDDLMELIKFEKKLLPHIHLSVQSGDNLILKRMKRRHNREVVIKVCEDLRNHRKDITFGADLIVGFPTETDLHFKNTLDLITKCKFNNVHFFPFSPRNKTPAEKMPQVLNSIIKSRIKIAKNFTNRLIQEVAKKKIGDDTEILFETKDLSYTNNFYKVTVDLKNKKIDKMNGQIIKVKLKSFSNGKFFAEI
ncbi:MAG: tRNA (N(6)-L-threonylcarbamoyladenosine(37)-C(2))-methylthiotransferase MtaB [Rickettsiales bacterium]|nr:tRNA (N(6)-L-threonylcarbamoyladenosine(37)-C(2))-methylthiotransferase MtaB [Rickettsiales bacterium]|tara:strand:- start:3637 stop:4881 length:1245 start_codon:yes stop_codon:yes gene_type:complete